MTDLSPPVFPRYLPPPGPDDVLSCMPLLASLNERSQWCRVTLVGVVAEVPDALSHSRCGFKSMLVLKDPSCALADSPRADLLLFVFIKHGETSACDVASLFTVGRVVCARRVKMEMHNGKLDGRVFSLHDLLVFDNQQSAAQGALLCRTGQTVSEQEQRRVSWLYDWLTQYWRPVWSEWISGASTVATINHLRHAGLYNLHVQIVDVSQDATMLRVTDGTACPLRVQVHDGVTEYCDSGRGLLVQMRCARCSTALSLLKTSTSSAATAGPVCVMLKRVRVQKLPPPEETSVATAGCVFLVAMLAEDEPAIVPLAGNHLQQLRQQFASRLAVAAHTTPGACHVTSRGQPRSALTAKVVTITDAPRLNVAQLGQLTANSSAIVRAYVRLCDSRRQRGPSDGLSSRVGWLLVCPRCGTKQSPSNSHYRVMSSLRADGVCSKSACGCIMSAQPVFTMLLSSTPFPQHSTSNNTCSSAEYKQCERVWVFGRNSLLFLNMAAPIADSLELTSRWVVDRLSRLGQCELLVLRMQKGQLCLINTSIVHQTAN